MGRYYSGDIEGKFWFGVQSSSAADRFGVEGYEPNYINYCFQKEDLPKVTKELKLIRLCLGNMYNLIKKYFREHQYYTDAQMSKDLGVTENELRHYISEYADYCLGAKIWWCLRKNGICEFEAEC